MQMFICQKNIENYLRLLQSELSQSQRTQIEALLAAEQKNLEELQHSSASTKVILESDLGRCAGKFTADRPTGVPRRAP